MQRIKWNNERAIKELFAIFKTTQNVEKDDPDMYCFIYENIHWFFNKSQLLKWNNLISSFIEHYGYNNKIEYEKVNSLFKESYAKKRSSTYPSIELKDILNIKKKIDDEINTEHTFYFSLSNIFIEKFFNFSDISLIPKNSKNSYYEEIDHIEITLLLSHVNKNILT